MAKKEVSKTKKPTKLKRKIPIVRLFLYAAFNNTILTLTELDGKVIAWSSAKKVGFKGAKKSTPFAAQKVSEEILERVKQLESTNVHIVIKGAGMGRDAFLRAIQNSDLQVDSIKDVTGFPFGGVTLKKRRRV
jgi:small subunit ribosomal protein S11